MLEDEVTRVRSRDLTAKLSRSQMYRDYERAFRRASGLPVALRAVESFQLAAGSPRNANPFCALMADTNQSCAACLRLQADLEREARLKPKTLKCFAGLCDTAIPVRVGDNLIAFLQTGQVLLHEPSKRELSRTSRKLLSMGAKIDLRKMEEAYFQTRVLSPAQYQAFVRLLTTFAEHLAVISNQMALREQGAEPAMVVKARRFILDRYDSALSLGEVAKAVNASTHYFCKVFRTATGLTFTDYLNRIRIEKAKNLLTNPNRRVSEVAYEVGFQSLSQFNRSFKRIAGATPTRYREDSAF